MPSIFDLIDDYTHAPTTAPEYCWDHGQDSGLAYQGRLAQWILLITTGAGGLPPHSASGLPELVRLASLIGVPQLADPSCTATTIRAALEQAANALPIHLVPVSPCPLRGVVEWLAHGAGLSDLERDLLELVLALKRFPSLGRAGETWGLLDHGAMVQALSVLLYRSPKEVASALLPDSSLQRSALIHYSGGSSQLKHGLRVPHHISSRLDLIEHPEQILRHVISPMPTAKCQLVDFAYMDQSTRLARCWLAAALNNAKKHGRAGHLLVTGAPGLGKTEWVRALTSEVLSACGGQAHELVVLDDDGSPLTGGERLSHLRLALQLKRSSDNTVLIFDEADDVFRGTGGLGGLDIESVRHHHESSGDSEAVSMRNHRASLNRLIEDSPLPVIWIMNHSEVLDPAVLRRFDAVIVFEAMPRSVRKGLLQSAQVADDTTAGLWSGLRELTPALIERLSHLQQGARQAGVPMDQGLSRHWLRQRLHGKQARKLLGAGPDTVHSLWQADQVHASVDLLALAQGIGRCGQARILLHGAPGTGKTAFAHALANLIDRPLLTQRASDLLSAYVGETEQRISMVFEQAMDEDAVLFIDEVDSLLAQRSQAVRTWEVSQVNELLEHLGEFDGVVVLATNRLEALDPAVIRRMDTRVEFKTLTSEQCRLNLERLCAQLQVPCSSYAAFSISEITGLTPGDFSQVARRWRFSPESRSCAPDKAADVLLQWLQQERTFRGQAKPGIGFLADWQAAQF